MKRKQTDLFDEAPFKNFDCETNFKYGINIKRNSNKQIVINANALSLFGAKIEQYLTDILTAELQKTFKINKSKKILIIGLGNKNITNDSLGPTTIEKLIVSRGLELKPEVSAFSPSVFSETGIETSEIVKAICQIVKPDLVVLIDSLATLSVSRLCSCFQISEGGLVAGSGAETSNKKITKTFLEVKRVISIGVPMLIYANSIASETEDLNVKNCLSSFPSLILSPVDVKKTVELLAQIISGALNSSIFKNLSNEEIKTLIK